MPDIVQSRGGKKRVAYGMRKHVAVAVRDQSGFGGDFHSAEQNIILFLPKACVSTPIPVRENAARKSSA